MPRTRSVAWTLLAGLGFALVAAAAPAGQDKKADRDKIPDKRSYPGINDVSAFKSTPPVSEADLKKARAAFQSYAKYHADLISHPRVYENAAEFPPDPQIPSVDGDRGILASFGSLILVPEPGAKLVLEHANYIREMGAAVDATLKPIIENANAERIVRINATRMLAVACRSGAHPHWPTVTGLVTSPNIPPDVKYYAYQAAGNLLAAYDINDLRVRNHSVPLKDKQLGTLVAALEAAVIQPNTLVAGPPGADGKPTPLPPDQLAAVRYVRRGAVRALGQVRFASIPGPDGAPMYPAHTIARVAMSDPAINPPSDPMEVGDAVIGFCNMAHTKGYSPEAAADVVATGLITFASPRAANPSDKSLPWRGYAARLSDALNGWKATFDPAFDPSRPKVFEAALVPKPVNDVVTEADRNVLGPMEKSDSASRVATENLRAIRDGLRKDPKAAATLYRDNPKLTLPRK